jgi:hypothetical protein
MGSLKKPFGPPLSPCLSSTHPLRAPQGVARAAGWERGCYDPDTAGNPRESYE